MGNASLRNEQISKILTSTIKNLSDTAMSWNNKKKIHRLNFGMALSQV